MADEALRDRYAAATVQAEDALVEELVVQRPQAQAVVDVVRATQCPPAHMRGFQADRHRADAAVVAAEGTPVLVRGQHQLAHTPVSLPPPHDREPLGLRRLRIEADGFAQLTVERGREVQIEQQPGYAPQQFGFASQSGSEFRGEPTGGTGLQRAIVVMFYRSDDHDLRFPGEFH